MIKPEAYTKPDIVMEQMQRLKKLKLHYNCVLVTEKTRYDIAPWQDTVYYLPQVNRREYLMPLRMISIILRSIRILIKERPSAIVCTGVLATVPLCVLCKLCKKKVIFIESFAKSHSCTRAGSLVYRFADLFIVQWDSMKAVYPRAVVGGSIY